MNNHASQMSCYRPFYESVYRTDHSSNYGGDDDSRIAFIRQITKAWLERGGVTADDMVLELGCGLGYLSDFHPNWVGMEFSLQACGRIARRGVNGYILNADMQTLPFKTGSLRAVFSWVAIEHVPHPEYVLAEVERVLNSGGIAILAPAWNCRSWTVKHLEVRTYAELSWPDRLTKVMIPLRNCMIWRGFWALLLRIRREIAALRGPVAFDYRRLYPDFCASQIHLADDDAYASMDAHAAIIYYESRGWEILSHRTFASRFFVRNAPVVVRKPARD